MTLDNFEEARQFFGAHPAASCRGVAQSVVDLSQMLKNVNVPPTEASTPLPFMANLLSLLLACDLECLGELGPQCAQLESVRKEIEKWTLAPVKGPFVDVGILELE